MSKLDGLRAKPETLEYGGELFEIKSLTVKELAEFSQIASKGDAAESLAYLIKMTLKKSVNDATDEEIENLQTAFLIKLIDKISVVNGLDLKKKGENENNLALNN